MVFFVYMEGMWGRGVVKAEVHSWLVSDVVYVVWFSLRNPYEAAFPPCGSLVKQSGRVTRRNAGLRGRVNAAVWEGG